MLIGPRAIQSLTKLHSYKEQSVIYSWPDWILLRWTDEHDSVTYKSKNSANSDSIPLQVPMVKLFSSSQHHWSSFILHENFTLKIIPEIQKTNEAKMNCAACYHFDKQTISITDDHLLHDMWSRKKCLEVSFSNSSQGTKWYFPFLHFSLFQNNPLTVKDIIGTILTPSASRIKQKGKRVQW